MSDSIMGMNILSDHLIDMEYNVSNLPIYIKEERIESFANSQTSPHWNNGLEIIQIMVGSMQVTVNGSKYILSEGDICIINAGSIHYFIGIDDTSCVYNCYIVEETIFTSASYIKSQYMDPLFHALHPAINQMGHSHQSHARLEELLSQARSYSESRTTAYELHIIAIFHEVIATLYEAASATLMANNKYYSKPDESIRLMMTHIHKTYSNSISIEELCVVGRVSRTQCFALFKKYTGDTPADFILKYRLSIARIQLITSDMPIAQIATTCGFTHQSHLTSHFSKHYGLTPHQFRKKHSTYSYFQI